MYIKYDLSHKFWFKLLLVDAANVYILIKSYFTKPIFWTLPCTLEMKGKQYTCTLYCIVEQNKTNYVEDNSCFLLFQYAVTGHTFLAGCVSGARVDVKMVPPVIS